MYFEIIVKCYKERFVSLLMANFRKYTTSSGLNIIGGRDSSNNDELCFFAKPKDVLLHTNAPGSPFVNLGEEPSKQEIKEGAIFCAKFSQDWRDSKRDVSVNKFLRKDMVKDKKMKSGTWSVKRQKRMRVRKSDILEFEEGLKGGPAS